MHSSLYVFGPGRWRTQGWRRHMIKKVRSPGRLLRRMVELHQQGALRLDRTLFGLAEKVCKKAGAAGASRPSQT